MIDFDIQRFADDGETTSESTPESAPETQAEEQESIPEELGGLPEDIARETMAEWEQSQTTQEAEPAQAEPQITREDYQSKLEEINRLKAQLAQYQQPQQQQAQAQPQPATQTQQPQPPQAQQVPPAQFQIPQLKMTPELSKKISDAISAEAKAMTGFSDDDVASLDYADDDDPRLAQWAQAKNIAQSRVYTAIYQTQVAQQQQAQQFYNDHMAAVNTYNEFVKKEFAEPDFQAIQQFATNDFFNQLKPYEQAVIAQSYVRVERQIASPAEMMVVKDYYERAKAAYRSRGGRKRPTQQAKAMPPQLPRTDQLKGASTTSDGQFSTGDIERMLEGDFTKLTPQQQKALLGIS